MLELFCCIYYWPLLAYPPTLGMAPICWDCLLTMSLLFSLSSMTMCISCCCLGGACKFDFELLFNLE